MGLLLSLAALLLASCTAASSPSTGVAPAGAAPAPLWRHEIPGAERHPGILHVAGSRVYHQTTHAEGKSRLTARDLATGQPLWEQPFATKAMGPVWLAAGERIFYVPPVQAAAGGAPAQSVVALDAATGQPAWRFDQMAADATLAAHGDCLFTADVQGRLLCLDGADGHIRSSYPDAAAAARALSEDAVHLLSPEGALRVYDIPARGATGDAPLAYSVTLAFAGVPDAFDVQVGHAFVHTRPAEKAPPRPTLMGLPAGRLFVFELPSGRLLWEAPEVGGLLDVIPFDGRNYALVARPSPEEYGDDPSAGLMVFDLATGQELYSVNALRRHHWVSPDARLITYSADGELAAYDLPTGARLWSADSDSDDPVSIGGQGQFAYLVASNDIVSSHASSAIDRFEVFDVGSGRRVWRAKGWVQAGAVPDPPGLLVAEIGALSFYSSAQ